MAGRRIAYMHNVENVNMHPIGKQINVQPEIIKRAALGELGNRLQESKKEDSSKQNVQMEPPGIILKKTAVPSKKDSCKLITNITEATKKRPLIRQESLIKPLPLADKKKTSVGFGKPPIILNPDEDCKDDPQMVSEYINDIFQYLREIENKYLIRENFLEKHESTPKMRAILVNWLIEVHLTYRFTLETLHICISQIDRYLQENPKIGKSTLQLVGLSSLFIASKYEEIMTPDLSDFEYVCDNTFTKRQILQMEIDILKRLNFNLGKPTPVHFLRRYNKIAQTRLEHHTLGKYILELALLEYSLCHVKPSIQAAAACCLSMGILNETMDLQKLWTPTLAHYTSYDYNQFRAVMIQFAVLLAKSEKSKYQEPRKKYAASKFQKISVNPKLNGPLIRKLTMGKKL